MLATSKNDRCVIVQEKNSKLKPDTIFFIMMLKRGLIYPIRCHPIIVVCAEP